MLFVDNQNVNDPRINLAIEEYLLRSVKLSEPLLLFYINAPSVIIGRNQNTIEEIDGNYIEANNIHVVRRLSGGGAVYHDLGNLNFSFVTNGRSGLHQFERFVEPVIEVLHQLGVPAELSGRSDIFVEGKKISGNAQYAAADRMFSHGTLLFDTNLEHLLKALNPKQNKIESNAVQSIRNFVTNIREWLSEDMEIAQFREVLLDGLFPHKRVTYELTPFDWQQIDQLVEERYQMWDWNYGRSPKFNIRKSGQLAVGKIDAHIDVVEGKIKNVRFFGDFTGEKNIAQLETYLIGVPYQKENLRDFFAEAVIADYFGDLDVEELLNLVYG